jgi:hypothetical protein
LAVVHFFLAHGAELKARLLIFYALSIGLLKSSIFYSLNCREEQKREEANNDSIM